MDKHTYIRKECAVFMRSRDQFGDLSNMTFGYPLVVNGITFQSPEGLYQALKFPDDIKHQKLIASCTSGMEAKRVAYQSTQIRKEWEQLKVDAMAYVLATKLRQHPKKFMVALLETGTTRIVEMSWKDDYWGARPNSEPTIKLGTDELGETLVGHNVLGRLLAALRTALHEKNKDVIEGTKYYLEPLRIHLLSINGRSVEC